MAEKELAIIIRVNGLDNLKFTTDEMTKLNAQRRIERRESDLAAKSINAEAGSIAKLRADTALLKIASENAARATKEQRIEAEKIDKQYQQNMATLRDHDRQMSGSTTLVGEYERGFAGAFKSIGATIVKTGVAIAAIRTGWELFNQTLGQSEVISEGIERKIAGLKASVGILTGELIKAGEAVGGTNKEFINWGNVFSKILTFGAGILNVLPGVRNYIKGIKDDMNEAQKATEDAVKVQQDLQDMEGERLVQRAKANKALAEAKILAAQDKATAHDIQKAIDIENQILQEEIDYQTKVIENLKVIGDLKKKQGTFDVGREGLAIAQAEARLIDLQTESYTRQRKITTTLQREKKEANQDDIKATEEANKKKEQSDKEYFDQKMTDLKIEEDALWEKFDLEQKIIEDTAKLKEQADKEYFANKLEALQAEEQAIEEKFDYEMMLEDEKKKRKQEVLNESLTQTNNILNSIGSLFEANKQRELSAAGDNAKKREQIEKEYAKKQQAIAIAQAVTSAAQVILNALKTQPFIPLGLIAAAGATVQAGVQVAIIKSQKFAKGGLINGVGTDTSDNIPAMLSPGEAVINARALKINDKLTLRGTPLEIANAINTYKGTGRSLIPTNGYKFALGGMPEQSNALGFDINALSFNIAKAVNDKKVVLQLGEFYNANNTYAKINTRNSI